MHAFCYSKPECYKTLRIHLGKTVLKAYVADSFLKRMFGLMHWKRLENKEGMLFILRKPSKAGIWMHNMHFPIDIVWLNEKKEVIGIIKNAKPCRLLDCKIYAPSHPAKFVLEINAGLADKLGIKIRNRLRW